MKDEFLQELHAGSVEVSKIAEKLGISLDHGMSVLNKLKKDNPEWYVIHGIAEGGAIVILQTDYRRDIETFINGGGYAKQEYDKPIMDHEKLAILQEVYENPSKEVTIDWKEEKLKYYRRKKLIEVLKAQGYLQTGSVTKMFTAYKLTDAGLNAALNDTLNFIPQPGRSEAPTSVAYHTTITQNISGAGHSTKILQAGDNSTIKDKKESESIFDKIIGWFAGLFK